MKRIISTIAAVVLCLATATACYCDGRMIAPEKLPAAAKTFIQQSFPDAAIAFAERDSNEYEVHLNDGTEITFDLKGNWDKVDCNFSPVPDEIVPQPIATYVEKNFPGVSIVKIDKERYGYEVELANDLELKFNKQGVLFSMDD